MSGSESTSPQQCVVLAAGRGEPLPPYTDAGIPKAFVPVAGLPMIQHCLSSFRCAGVDNFLVATGFFAEVFTKRRNELGQGVTCTENPKHASTGMLVSLACTASSWDADGGLYITYGDIVFTEQVVRKLKAAKGDICVVVDRERLVNWHAPHRMDVKPFGQIEVVAVETLCDFVGAVHSGEGSEKTVRVSRIGKGRCGHTATDTAVWGEFIGMAKFNAEGLRLMLTSLDEFGLVQPELEGAPASRGK